VRPRRVAHRIAAWHGRGRGPPPQVHELAAHGKNADPIVSRLHLNCDGAVGGTAGQGGDALETAAELELRGWGATAESRAARGVSRMHGRAHRGIRFRLRTTKTVSSRNFLL
jgi:hypothetical protein